jgi:HEAT repeat protein
VDEFRLAADHSSGLIREAAIYLLVRQPDPVDEALFLKGLEDIDETVQSLSAYGLVRLGHDSAESTLKRIAQQDPGAILAAPLAASLLAELGDPSAFDTMIQAMADQFGYVRLIAMQYMSSFVPLHGQSTSSGQTVDVWSLYCQALGDEDGQVRAVAEMQLVEIDSAAAMAILKECSNP